MVGGWRTLITALLIALHLLLHRDGYNPKTSIRTCIIGRNIMLHSEDNQNLRIRSRSAYNIYVVIKNWVIV